MKKPFKFLDFYEREDQDIFFGREEEAEEIHSRLFHSRMLLIYGHSGTGKTSLIRCGLWKFFSDQEWLPIYVRRNQDLLSSLFLALDEHSHSGLSDRDSLEDKLESLHLDYFCPIYIFFDQFEEIFIFGSRQERREFSEQVARVINNGVDVHFIFVLREEYLACLSELEVSLPDLFANRVRLERITSTKASRIINNSCAACGIEVQTGVAKEIINSICFNPKMELELTYLQLVFARLQDVMLTKSRLERKDVLALGSLDNILGEFLQNQLSQTSNPQVARDLLALFVSTQGTKKTVSLDQVVLPDQSPEQVRHLAQQLVDRRLLKEKKGGEFFEMRHDALADKVVQLLTPLEKEVLEARELLFSRFAEYQRRGTLLDKGSLEFLSRFAGRLQIGSKQQEFLDKSRRARARERSRLLWLAGAGFVLVLAIVSGLGLFSFAKYRQAQNSLHQSRQMLKNSLGAYWLLALSHDFADGKLHNLSRLDDMVQTMLKGDEQQLLDLSLQLEEYLREKGGARKTSAFYDEWVSSNPQSLSFDFDTLYANLYSFDPKSSSQRFFQDSVVFALFWSKPQISALKHILQLLLLPKHPAIFDKYGISLSKQQQQRLQYMVLWLGFWEQPDKQQMEQLLSNEYFEEMILGRVFGFAEFFNSWSLKTFFGYFFSQTSQDMKEYFQRPPRRLAEFLTQLKNVLDCWAKSGAAGGIAPELVAKAEKLCKTGMYLIKLPEVMPIAGQEQALKNILSNYPSYLLSQAKYLLQAKKFSLALQQTQKILAIYAYDYKAMQMKIKIFQAQGEEQKAADEKLKMKKIWH